MSTLAHTVARSVLLEAAPEQVWEAITDERALSEWLAPEVELEPHQGGEIVCRYEDGEERRGEVELVEEAERLAFHWQRTGLPPTKVELILDAVATGTRLTVLETGGRRDDLSIQGRQIGPSTKMLGASWGSRLASLRLALGRLVLA